MVTCNFNIIINSSQYNFDYNVTYNDIFYSPLFLSWYSLLLIVSLVYFLFILISIAWLIVLGKRYRKMKKQQTNEIEIESGEYFQLQYKLKVLKLFILLIILELIIGILLFIPNLCMAVRVFVQLYNNNFFCSIATFDGTTYLVRYNYLSSTTYTTVLNLILYYAYCLSLLLKYGGFTFHTLTLAAIVQFYINIYSSIRESVPPRKYLIAATLQFLSIIMLSPFIVTSPIITLLLFIYYPIDLYFLIRNSRRLKHLLVVSRNEAALIGPEILKEHENHLKYFKRIWSSFLVSFVICIFSLIIQSIIISALIEFYAYFIFKYFPNFFQFIPISFLRKIVDTVLVFGTRTLTLVDIIRIVTSFGYLQFLLYTIVSSIMYASVYLFKIIKPCCKPRENELRPLLDEYRNNVLAIRDADINNQERPKNSFENNYIASTFLVK